MISLSPIKMKEKRVEDLVVLIDGIRFFGFRYPVSQLNVTCSGFPKKVRSPETGNRSTGNQKKHN